MPSPLSILSLVGTVSALAVKRQNTTTADYFYFPLDFDYGVDSRFTTNITFGTYDNAKSVKMVMDTGSANIWTWAPGGIMNWGSPYLLTQGPCNQTVPTGYEPSLSSTGSLTNHSSAYAYAGNSKIVTGSVYATDTVTPVGGNAGLPNTQFALEDFGIMKINDDGTCSTISYDKGILGLAPYINDSRLAAGPLFRKSAYDAGTLQSEVLFMWMDKFTGTVGDDLTGGMLLSAVDTSKYAGDLVRVQSMQEASTVGPYVAKMNITVYGQTITPDVEVDCLVDSGAHADNLPISYESDAYYTLFNETGGKLIDYNGLIAYNGTCDTIPTSTNITYTFAAETSGETIDIDIPLRNFARGYDIPGTEDICILSVEYDSGCTLGATFLTGAVMALDDADGSVAFAQGGISTSGSGVDEASLKILSRGQSYDS